MEIWSERPHRSVISGDYLGEEPLTLFFEHLLEKGDERYKHLKYDKRNIILVTGEEHQKKTNGHPLPKHKELIEQAKKELCNNQ